LSGWVAVVTLGPGRAIAVGVGRANADGRHCAISEGGDFVPDLKGLLNRPEFPLSGRYPPDWILDNQMGPNALWLVQWLLEAVPLKPGMRVLDLGCGRALSSIFLAREFGVQVWAVDLWISPDHNRRRAEAAGAGDSVHPLRAEAHALPFANDFFDVIVSIDAYHYFGTDVLYLGYLSRSLRQDGHVGIVVPGLMQPVVDVPEHLACPQSNGKVFWEDECWSFKTADWWGEHWSRNRCITDVRVNTLRDGWRHWRDFERALEATGRSVFPSDAEALDKDRGRYVGFVRAVARRSGPAGENLYDPALGLAAGVDG
jgi:SAM-dependent methyltransferase